MAQRSGDRDDRVCVGAVAGAFGVRGEARIKAFTQDPEAIGDYGPLETEDGARRFEFRLTRVVKGGVAGFLAGVATREQAEALRGERLYVPRQALPAPEEDEYYHADLIGMAVVDASGAELGAVRSVQNYGAGDFLEIVVPGRRAPALLPFTREAAPSVDLKARRILVDPPEGVFGEEESAPQEAAEDGPAPAPEGEDAP